MIWGALGTLADSLVTITTALVPRDHLPGGPNFILLGAICSGLVGGSPTITAALNAYISDATPPGSKAMGFTMLLGLFYLGIAIGPVIGGHIVAAAGLVSVLAVSAFFIALYFVVVTLLLPESCSPAMLAHA